MMHHVVHFLPACPPLPRLPRPNRGRPDQAGFACASLCLGHRCAETCMRRVRRAVRAELRMGLAASHAPALTPERTGCRASVLIADARACSGTYANSAGCLNIRCRSPKLHAKPVLAPSRATHSAASYADAHLEVTRHDCRVLTRWSKHLGSASSLHTHASAELCQRSTPHLTHDSDDTAQHHQLYSCIPSRHGNAVSCTGPETSDRWSPIGHRSAVVRSPSPAAPSISPCRPCQAARPAYRMLRCPACEGGETPHLPPFQAVRQDRERSRFPSDGPCL